MTVLIPSPVPAPDPELRKPELFDKLFMFAGNRNRLMTMLVSVGVLVGIALTSLCN